MKHMQHNTQLYSAFRLVNSIHTII